MMKNNLPASHLETHPPKGEFIYAITDLQGKIVDANDAFASLSNFTREEMIGQPQTLVRHPEMPAEVFADLWSDLMTGRPWRGIIKNRRKDGGFYWVVANVSTVRKNGQVIGYQSIHGLPTPEEISTAQEAYLRLSAGDTSIYIKHGRIITSRPAWISILLSLRVQMILTGLLILLPALAIVSNSLDGPSLSPDTALTVAALSLVYAVYYLWFYIPQTTRDLNNTAAWLESILRSGNLKQRFDVDRTDVIGSIARKADEFVASIQATIQGIGDLADQVSFATREVHSVAKTPHDSVPKQNQTTSSATAATEQLTLAIGKMANQTGEP